MDVASELGAMSYVDAASGELLVRDGIVDHAVDNPAWKVFPASPPLTYASTDTREIWCWNAAPRLREGGREPVLAGGVGRRRGHEHADLPDPRQQRACDGQVELERRQPRGHGLQLVRDARLRLPVDEPVVHVALQPGLVHVAPEERHRRGAGQPARDAQPDARLVVRARLHRDGVQRPGVQLRQGRRCRATRSTATPRPAASSAGRPASPRATTPTSSRRPTASCR